MTQRQPKPGSRGLVYDFKTMPHVIVEHSSDIDVKPLLPKLHETAAGFDTVKPEAIKTRADMFRFHTVAGSTETSFIHIEFRLLEGRNVDLKNQFAEALHREAKEFASAQGGNVAVSTHVSELVKEFYRTELVT